jgi:hypothetical protein
MTTKIDINKQYQTRDGHEARVLRISADDVLYQVIGRIKVDNDWKAEDWNIFGSYHDGDEHPFDLIEVTEENTSDFDPTQNEKPFGLLTEEEQGILRNWPHGVERYISYGEWKEISDPSYLLGAAYRAKPAPERLVMWCNVYDGWVGPWCRSRKDADHHQSGARLCVYRIERDADGSNPEIFVEDV